MHCAELTGRKETRKDGESVNVCVCVCVWVCVRERERERERERSSGNRNKLRRWPIFSNPATSSAAQMFPQSPCSWNPRPWNPATTPGCMDGRRSNCVCVPVCPTYVMHQRCVFICLCVCVCCCSMCGRICAVFFYLFIYLFLFLGLKEHFTDFSTYVYTCQ